MSCMEYVVLCFFVDFVSKGHSDLLDPFRKAAEALNAIILKY